MPPTYLSLLLTQQTQLERQFLLFIFKENIINHLHFVRASLLFLLTSIMFDILIPFSNDITQMLIATGSLQILPRQGSLIAMLSSAKISIIFMGFWICLFVCLFFPFTSLKYDAFYSNLGYNCLQSLLLYALKNNDIYFYI